MIVHALAPGARHNMERLDEMQFPVARKIGRTRKWAEATSMDLPARDPDGRRADGPGKLQPWDETCPERLEPN